MKTFLFALFLCISVLEARENPFFPIEADFDKTERNSTRVTAAAIQTEKDQIPPKIEDAGPKEDQADKKIEILL
jgi:hypothetical protein